MLPTTPAEHDALRHYIAATSSDRWAERVRAESAWLGAAIDWVRDHPDADVARVIAAIPNPHDLLIRPLAGAAVAVAGWDPEADKAAVISRSGDEMRLAIGPKPRKPRQ